MSTTQPPQPQTIDEVRDWYENMDQCVLSHRVAVLASARAGLLPANTRFFAMALDEIEDFYRSQRKELEQLTVLALMASAEASIRADYANRLKKGRSDPLSKAYAALHRNLDARFRNRPSLNDHIVETLKAAAVIPNHLVGNFRDALLLRHWLAHGRYWAVDLGRNTYAPDDIYRTIAAFLSAMPP
ncbi:MAG: hypothetical protein ACHRHE_02175 [Tepidisphaerales bacterium]